MLLPRSDCVLSFAGLTADAYPLMLQAYNAIEHFPKLKSGAMDICSLKGHLLRVFNFQRSFIGNLPHGQCAPDEPAAIFLLSGYSWREKRFRVWTLHYDANIQKFTFRPSMPWRGQANSEQKIIGFVGDDEAVKEAKIRLVDLLRLKQKLQSGGLDMEPFEILRDIIRSNMFPSVGGPPQLAKIYESQTRHPFEVYWPTKASGKISFMGRPLMPFEKASGKITDPDNP